MSPRKKSASSKAHKKDKKKMSIKKIIFTVIKVITISLIALVFALGGIFGGAIYGYIKTAQPIRNYELQIKIRTSFVYDNEGNEIAKLTGAENQNRELVYDKDIPKYLKDAFVAVEDERFYQHFGIDIKRSFDAAIRYIESKITGGDIQHGGSTITQQVVKNITGKTTQDLPRKIQEQWLAIDLEKRLKKWQILELYMNLINMGNGNYGVQSASKTYFNKDVKDLSLAECALLAGIPNAPSFYNPFGKEGRVNALSRQKIILKLMLEQQLIDEKEYNEALKEELSFAERDDKTNYISIQSYFVDQIINEVKNDLMTVRGMTERMALTYIYNYGLQIYTTQDSDMQNAMNEVFLDDQYFYLDNEKAQQMKETPQAAMVLIDHQTGEVKAMYGGYGEKKANRTFNRATQIKRQPGSSIKPLAVYGPAIDLGLITPATVIDDVPVYMNHLELDKRYPTNYNKNVYDGLTTVRNGLKASVNVVAARIWRDILGYKNSIEYLNKLGIIMPNNIDNNTVSIAMGGFDTGVSPLQMAAAYLPFANKGLYYEPITYTKVLDSNGTVLLEKEPKFHTVYKETSAYIMVDMMSEVTKPMNSTYPHSGTATRIKIQNGDMPIAGKTGTTSKNIDKWFVGYTPYYVAATWYGYDNNGSTFIKIERNEYAQAQKIWNAVMEKVHENLEPKDFPQPEGLVKKRICIYSGKIATELCTKDPRGNATREEFFIKGTEPRYNDLCDVHISEAVCLESQDIWGRNLLAGLYCPVESVVEKVFIQRPEPYTPLNPDDPYPVDWQYELQAGEYCIIHGAPVIDTDNEVDNKDNPITTESAVDIEQQTQLPSE